MFSADESILPPSLSKPKPAIPVKPTNVPKPVVTEKVETIQRTQLPSKPTAQDTSRSVEKPAPVKKSKEQLGQILYQRMEEYKEAAIQAKSAQDIALAKKYLLSYKKALNLKEQLDEGQAIGKFVLY
jgi:hypothetical protein